MNNFAVLPDLYRVTRHHHLDATMDAIELLVDLHRPNPHLGPGGLQQTLRALDLSGLRNRRNLHIADLGCGTGASTLVLADNLDADITAVDLFPAFLEELHTRAEQRGLGGRIRTLATNFDDLPFPDASLDAIWSEGAIYNLGFSAGVAAWRRYLKPGGVLAVSELTWLHPSPPRPLWDHWKAEYPEVGTAAEKIAVLESHGFTPIGYFPLPVECWLDNYYGPLQARFPAFLRQHGDAARALVAAEQAEIALYTEHQAHISYGFYIATRL